MGSVANIPDQEAHITPAESYQGRGSLPAFHMGGTNALWTSILDRILLLTSVCLVSNLWKTDSYSYLAAIQLRMLGFKSFYSYLEATNSFSETHLFNSLDICSYTQSWVLLNFFPVLSSLYDLLTLHMGEFFFLMKSFSDLKLGIKYNRIFLY